MNAAARKSTGSYYTCDSIADYIAEWAIDNPAVCVLEPSFGDGIFIDSAVSRFAELGNLTPNIIGVELQTDPFELYISNHSAVSGFHMDFMDYGKNEEINAIIGNPPYVSLKNLDAEKREKALQLVYSYGIDMHTSGSLWMPFIIHSTELLETHGKLGFVLPYEITYVRYAFDLWKYLFNNFGRITLCRIYRDFFPDVDVETIVLLAEDKGQTTDAVDYKVFQSITDLYEGNDYHTAKISIDEIIGMEKPFEKGLIPSKTSAILENLRRKGKLSKLVKDCKFKIGYVSGNKSFFHVDANTIKEFGITESNLKECLVNAKQISSNRNAGIETDKMPNFSHLFYPIEINEGERKYIEYGEKRGVNRGYKCRVRKPWYLTPGLEVPDVILTVFGNVPKLLLNNGRFYVSNSLLSGFLNIFNGKELLCRWYNSLTLLSIETSIHSLGGGTLVLIPGETDKLEVISNFPKNEVEVIYNKLSKFAREHDIKELYEYGDEIVLKDLYGFSDTEIQEIRNAIFVLRQWRNPEKRRG